MADGFRKIRYSVYFNSIIRGWGWVIVKRECYGFILPFISPEQPEQEIVE